MPPNPAERSSRTMTPAHALVRRSEECAGYGAGIAPGLAKGVASHLDAVAEIAVLPHGARAEGAQCGAGRPVLQGRESEIAVERIKAHCKLGGPGDSLGRGCEAEKTSRPVRGSGEVRILPEFGARPWASGPGLYQTIGESGPERDFVIGEAEHAIEMRRGIGPRPEVDLDRIRRATGLDAAVDREEGRPVEEVEDVQRRAVAAPRHHDAVGKPCRVGWARPST